MATITIVALAASMPLAALTAHAETIPPLRCVHAGVPGLTAFYIVTGDTVQIDKTSDSRVGGVSTAERGSRGSGSTGHS